MLKSSQHDILLASSGIFLINFSFQLLAYFFKNKNYVQYCCGLLWTQSITNVIEEKKNRKKDRKKRELKLFLLCRWLIAHCPLICSNECLWPNNFSYPFHLYSNHVCFCRTIQILFFLTLHILPFASKALNSDNSKMVKTYSRKMGSASVVMTG